MNLKKWFDLLQKTQGIETIDIFKFRDDTLPEISRNMQLLENLKQSLQPFHENRL